MTPVDELTMDLMDSTSHADVVGAFDQFEGALAKNFPPVQCPVEHSFIPHFYVRTIHMPAGSMVTSKIHMTEHPFVITKGSVSVYTAEEGVIHLQAPHAGITKPGTRRILHVHTDCTWSTFHSRTEDETTVDQIEERIIMKHDNPFLTQEGRVNLSAGQ